MCARREHIFVISILTMFLFFFFLFYCELVNLLHTFRFLLLFPCRRRRLRRLLLFFSYTIFSDFYFLRERILQMHTHTHIGSKRARQKTFFCQYFFYYLARLFFLFIYFLSISLFSTSRVRTHTHTHAYVQIEDLDHLPNLLFFH